MKEMVEDIKNSMRCSDVKYYGGGRTPAILVNNIILFLLPRANLIQFLIFLLYKLELQSMVIRTAGNNYFI